MEATQDEIVLVRHGETEWSRAGKHTGRTDVSLTPHGRRQAEAIRHALRERHFSAVVTSPLTRAVDTCRLAGLGGAEQQWPDLAEWDYGDYEGLTTAEIRTTRPGWTLWRDGVPGGETIDQVGARADAAIVELRRLTGDVAVFGHGHFLRVLTARWLDLPAVDGRSFVLDPGTISILGYERETAAIRLWNEAPPAP
jgi:broad specificity phosphatase PhoE